MATNLISFPFRLAPNGSVVTRPDSTSEYYAEEIAQMILTRSGERVLAPSFGLDDPTFGTIDQQELAHKLALFGVPVRIAGINVAQVSDYQQDVSVSFQMTEFTGTSRTNVTDVRG